MGPSIMNTYQKLVLILQWVDYYSDSVFIESVHVAVNSISVENIVYNLSVQILFAAYWLFPSVTNIHVFPQHTMYI